MKLGMNLGFAATSGGGGAPADPYASLLALFAADEPGEVWPVHEDYLFTDTACTTPVSAVGDEIQGWLGAKYGVKFTSSTAGRMPKYARQPVGGWTQQFLETEDLSASPWTRLNTTVTSGQSDPDGGSNAWLLTCTTTGNAANLTQICSRGNGAHTYSWIVKAGTVNRVLMTMYKTGGYSDNIFDTSTGTWPVADGTVTQAATDLGSGWWRISLTFTGAISDTTQPVFIVCPIDNAGTAYNSTTIGNTIYIYHPMHNSGSSPGTYEARGSAVEGPATGESVAAIWFDGDSDGMSTPAVNLTSTNETTIWWGWDKHLATNTVGVIIESSSDINFNDGIFRVAENGVIGGASANRYYFSGKGNAMLSQYLTEQMTARHRAVGGLAIDLSAGASALSARVTDANGTFTTLATDSGTTTGTGNFGNHTFHCGTRGGGTGLDAHGYMIGALVVLGRAPTGTEFADTVTTLGGLV